MEHTLANTQGSNALERLRALVDAQAIAQGRTDTPHAGLRFYRFSHPVEYTKTQLLMPGLVLVLQGAKTARLGHKTLRYDAAHYLVLGAQTVCLGTVVEASAERPYLAIHLDIAPDILVKVFMALQSSKTTPGGGAVNEHCTARIDPRVVDVLARLIPAVHDPLDMQLIVPLLLEELVVRLVQSDAGRSLRDAAAISRSAAQIQRSMQFIQAQYHRPLGIAELARHSAMSPSHYAHSFREIAGTSPMRYLRGLRLDKAYGLLCSTGARPGEVADSLGFESVEHFTREFKRRFGLSPAAHARQYKQTS